MNNNSVFDLQQQKPLDEKLTSLIARCGNGDDGALAELYQLTAANLYATQVRILGPGSMAERALHDTYIRIWLASSEYSQIFGTPSAWLTSVARNQALNLKRGRDTVNNTDADLDAVVELEAEYLDTAFLKYNPACEPLKRCLDELDINTRDAVIRAYLDGWSLEELSEAYNKPVESLSAAIHEAMLSLRVQS